MFAAMRPAQAQQRGAPRRIAIFHPAIPVALLTDTGGGSAWRAFFGELRQLGYVEGQNLLIERYSAEGHHERYAEIARQIVDSKPDLIITGPNPPVLAFKAVTSTIPIVAFMIDPLKGGLIVSLARPHADDVSKPRLCRCRRTDGVYRGPCRAVAAHGP